LGMSATRSAPAAGTTISAVSTGKVAWVSDIRPAPTAARRG
jgi:hypothetical protein